MAATVASCPDKTPLRAATQTRMLLATNRQLEVNPTHKQALDRVQRVTYGASLLSLINPSLECVVGELFPFIPCICMFPFGFIVRYLYNCT